MTPEQFTPERKYPRNVSPRTLACIATASKGLEAAHAALRTWEALVNRSSGGFFALKLVDPVERVETLIARFTAVGLNVRRKQDLIHYAWP